MKNKIKKIALTTSGIILIPVVWIVLKYLDVISDRYLPSIQSVIDAFLSIEPNILIHSYWSLLRLVVGFTGGTVIGIVLGLYLFKSRVLNKLLYPGIQSLRSIPAAATVPFFLLWFGFEETGKLLLIFTGIAFNLSITTLEVLSRIPEKYLIFFSSIKSSPRDKLNYFALPFVLEKILPTLRFSLSTAISLVVISELLGSQVGLGYLIQTARSTFSMNVIFASMILLGIMNYTADKILIVSWKKLIYWRI
ncbi:MAG: ABC transporter permease subunit [Melioribacteraceae bacterium]|nr:ABC transporter permease subunit [Melioribacteraceae bacterium]MCF8353918.1 ABC transporter permease subunit [Melioribacteraceae bacterium]MCF8392675.1 ABC transporter permease subunit [Melioribacteraceae bacterium]MCF8417696.1 ABC transporter permease subunit [Melioribacteraceae bacterium]